MDIDFIEKLIELARKTGIAGLEYEAGGEVVRISMADGAPTAATWTPAALHENTPSAGPDAPAAPAACPVTSGMAGTFYRASAPGADPYVRIGDAIVEGQVLGLIEAMKMLTPIEAERAGRIAAIKVQDGAAVERGTLLFEISGAD